MSLFDEEFKVEEVKTKEIVNSEIKKETTENEIINEDVNKNSTEIQVVEDDFSDADLQDPEDVDQEISNIVEDLIGDDLFTMKEKDKVRPKLDKNKKYDMIPKITQQFRFCGNPFRIDCYKGCDFGCKYCFANASNLLGRKGWQTGDIARLERFMARALDKDENGNYLCDTNSLSMECVRHRVPFHCGGLSDPFQDREWELGITYKLLQLSKKYDYPIVFSTKGIIKDPKYWEVLDPRIHTFQLSLISKDTEFLHKYETNTATAEERLAFARELKRRGFWVCIRIQPCINLEKALELVKEISGEVDYIIVEHLKIDIGNDLIKSLFAEQLASGDYHRISTMLFEMDTNKKIQDIKEIKKVSKCKIGVGDNDLHYMSDSDCCCGIDTMGPEFENWLKYNMTYISHHMDEDNEKLWTPKSGCSECFFKGSFGNKVTADDIKDLDYKQYVAEYCRRHPEFMKPKQEYSFDLFSDI